MPGQDSRTGGLDFMFKLTCSICFAIFPPFPIFMMTSRFVLESPESYNKLNKNNLEVE
ncbi:MAG TPA: hypothetical protein VMV43_00295 [Candidatus Nanopelagicaceae bacterium]|nr:hypothetical protein [Candidatus Nanopelagicaceae bacterium]